MNEIYRQVIIDQKTELLQYNQSIYILRPEVSKINLASSLAQIITGVRRSGKSTLAHLALRGKNYAYLNFDDERLLNINAEDLNSLLETLYYIYGEFEYLFMDEVQNVEGWQLFVNRLLRQGLRIILTGSNSKLLSNELATHLTGRYNLIELYPLSFKEIVNKNNIPLVKRTTKDSGILKSLFDKYCQFGGFPELVNSEEFEKQYIDNLLKAIITKDIFYRYNVIHTKTFNDIANYLISNYSREISYSRIKNIFGIGSEHTVKNYVEYLEEAYLILTLPKFSYKSQETLRYRKTYVVDPSLASLLANDFTPNSGFLLENIVFLELRRRRISQQYEIYYYKKNYEIDFVIYSGSKVSELIQVSTEIENPKTLKRELSALIEASSELNCDKLRLITSYKKEVVEIQNKQIEIIPVIDWLLED